MKKLMGVLLCSFLSLVVEAKTLVVSDIDDTLKVQYVQKLTSAMTYMRDTDSRFLGMAELYKTIRGDVADVHFFYVSKAPMWLMSRTHREFLTKNHFPKGYYIGRLENSGKTHKVKVISQLIDENQPDDVILIGDNGEADISSYQQIEDLYKNKGIRFHTFIRDVYDSYIWGGKGHVVSSSQTLFVSPAEVAVELNKRQVMSDRSTEEFVQKFVPLFVKEETGKSRGLMAFPYFMKCQDFQWKWDSELSRFEELKSLKAKLYKVCH